MEIERTSLEPDSSPCCEVCGVLLADHRMMISFAERGTDADCSWVIRVRRCEAAVRRIASFFGVDIASVSNDVLRAAALELMDWRL